MSSAAMPNAAIPVGRLAPSPTGAQHVGNARTYLLAWLSIRSRGGRLILRMEDIDSPRIKPGADAQALADLRWLGLDWDEGPDLGGPHAPYVQTQRLAIYAQAFEQLRAAERVYPCTCTRGDVLAAASAPHVGEEGPRYPGTCAARRAEDAERLGGRPFCWRFRASSAARSFADRVAGAQACNVAEQHGDFVIRKHDGTPAYQLAVVCDDHHMGITEVVRGSDLIPSTFRQLEFYDFFGWTPPTFAHVPLVVGADGRRLAKRHGDTRLATLRARGMSAEALIGQLAQASGLRSTPDPIQARDLLSNFDFRLLPREPWVYSTSD